MDRCEAQLVLGMCTGVIIELSIVGMSLDSHRLDLAMDMLTGRYADASFRHAENLRHLEPQQADCTRSVLYTFALYRHQPGKSPVIPL